MQISYICINYFTADQQVDINYYTKEKLYSMIFLTMNLDFPKHTQNKNKNKREKGELYITKSFSYLCSIDQEV